MGCFRFIPPDLETVAYSILEFVLYLGACLTKEGINVGLLLNKLGGDPNRCLVLVEVKALLSQVFLKL